MPDLRIELGELWRLVNREMHERIKEAFKDLDFSPMALTLLRHIHKEPGITVNQLARLSGTVKSHVSKLVDQLVVSGWVEKRTDPADQRLVRLYPTVRAEMKRAEIETHMRRAWMTVVNEIADDELEAAVNGLRTLLAALQRADVTPNSQFNQNGDEPL